MPFDDEPDDAPDDASGFQPPLPPDDRLWRHPSEMVTGGSAGAAASSTGGITIVNRPRVGGFRVWLVAGTSAVAGAGLTIAILFGTGSLSPDPSPPPVEQVQIAVPKDPGASEVELAHALSPSVAHIVSEGSLGSPTGTAIVLRSDGHLVTTADAVDGARQITVTFSDGQASSGTVVGTDPDNDLAVVKVDRSDLVAATIAQDGQLQLGERTTVISSADEVEGRSTVAVGLVSGLGERIDVPSGKPMHGMIQTNIRLSTAETGAPLIDDSGAVVGLITRRGQDPMATATTTDGTSPGDEGVSVRYAISISWAKSVADDLIDQGHPTHVWLGIRGGELSEAEVEDEGRDGARITEVTDASPADAAGLETGDIITSVDDGAVTSMSDLIVSVREHDPGEAVAVAYQRGGEPGMALVTLAGQDG